jgi:DNA repair exonuclease SbcCD ATPase subunit
MNIRSIAMQGFTSHASSEIGLPENGIVLVSGVNGGGKSSLVEAVAVAAFGKTLRGTDPWAGDAGEVHIRTESHWASRFHSKNRTALRWNKINESAPLEYENNTKAQAALESVIGSFDVWRRTCVFSSQDAAHFTTSTDGERKRLLEAVLGLGRFDEALEYCRKDAAAINSQLSANERELAMLEVRLQGERQRLQDAETSLATMPSINLSDILAKLKENDGLAVACESELKSIRSAMTTTTQTSARSMAEIGMLEQQLRELQHESCPTCKRPITDDFRCRTKIKIDALRKTAKRSEHEQEDMLRGMSEQMHDLEEALSVYVRRREEARAQATIVRKATADRAKAEKLVNLISSEICTLEAKIQQLQQELNEAANEKALLDATDRVLGLKGVRAHILGKALSGVEQIANAWLASLNMLGSKRSYSIKLKSYSEKKTGGTTDAISIEVSGAGGGRGYKAASGGERRRIDVALLLALAEVADAASGRKPGTLFLDEVFDSLDSEGIEFVAHALDTLSKRRAVIVISHSDELAKRLDKCLHLQVEAGKITQK